MASKRTSKQNQPKPKPRTNRRKVQATRITNARVTIARRPPPPQPPRRFRRRRRGNNALPKRINTLSAHALKYALACTDPFAVGARGAGIPVGGMATHKAHANLRFVTPIGLAGFGYVLVTPTPFSDLPAFYYTDNAFVNAYAEVLVADNTTAVGVTRGYLPFPHASSVAIDADFFARMSTRIVSYGLRIRYVGTSLNMSGRTLLWRNQRHNPVQRVDNAPATTVTWGSKRETVIVQNGRAWQTIHDHAHENSEVELRDFDAEEKSNIGVAATNYFWPFSQGEQRFVAFGGAEYTDVIATHHVGAPTFGVIFTGVPGELMEIEVIAHCEYAGQSSQASATVNHDDRAGAMRVLSAAQNTALARQTSAPTGAWQVMANELSKEAQSLVPKSIPAGISDVEKIVALVA